MYPRTETSGGYLDFFPKVGNGFGRIRTGTEVFVWRYPTCG
jgi:hypothetical protein